MKAFYKKAIAFWFVLFIVAMANAIIREATYKPLLSPHIGMWAHQISSLTGIIAFFIVIYYFLKTVKDPYINKDLLIIGNIWFVMTIAFETSMNLFLRHLSFHQILTTYYFWNGETWIFVLLSLIISPLIAGKSIISQRLKPRS
jgi:hypothetical protein